jgi:hypothetical protein
MGISDEDDPIIEEVLPAFSMLTSPMYQEYFIMTIVAPTFQC